ncbi:MAG: hypothetical protein R2712_24230 [Vicinamibacterales bacterium]
MQSAPVREVEVQNYHVAVASARTLWAMVTPEDVKLVAWPASSPMAGTFHSIEEVVNRGLHKRRSPSRPLTARPSWRPPAPAPACADDYGGHAGDLGQGERRHRCRRLRGAGHARGRRGHPRPPRGLIRVVVSNVQVLTSGTATTGEQARDGAPAAADHRGDPALVTPDEAERIALASTRGHHHADALRNPLDTAPTETTGTRMASLMGAPEAPPAPVVRQPVRRVETPRPPPPPADGLLRRDHPRRGAARS